MEVRPQETDFDFLVGNVEAAGVAMPLAPDAQTKRLHHFAGLGAIGAIPVSPQLLVEDEPGPGGGKVATSHNVSHCNKRGSCGHNLVRGTLVQEQGPW